MMTGMLRGASEDRRTADRWALLSFRGFTVFTCPGADSGVGLSESYSFSFCETIGTLVRMPASPAAAA